ncbi:Cis-3-chloroacrylic acid dehalogenase [Streptomyces hygroscopicus subsp. limoneus]|nr:Cis-3-chloroacrylic acid dehalogenase [Streptomyces hygroscopicus subsp. limoneus]
MPIYQCSAPVGLLTDDMKAAVATAITDAHVEATGAPKAFVHVFFHELPPGIAYSAGELDTDISGITGSIRAGRTLEVKQKLVKDIAASWTSITGQSPKQLIVGLNEIDSDITMEYGLILPHPGGEAEWFATHADELDGIQGTGL